VFAAVTLIDVIVQGTGRSAVIMTVVVVAITALVYGCALRPRIVADAGGITVENPLRDHRVPWGTVEKVDAVHAVRVHCAPAPGASKGKIINSWAVQSSPRAARAAEYRSRRQARRLGQPPGYGRYPAEAQEALRRSLAEATARQLDERASRERGAGAAGGPPEARWAWAAIAVMAVPLVALVVVVLA
jgi:plasmid stabilization system protein ParE